MSNWKKEMGSSSSFIAATTAWGEMEKKVGFSTRSTCSILLAYLQITHCLVALPGNTPFIRPVNNLIINYFIMNLEKVII